MYMQLHVTIIMLYTDISYCSGYADLSACKYMLIHVLHVRIQRGGGGAGGPDLTPKNHKNIDFLRNNGLSYMYMYQASIQCWAFIGPPAKRHFNGVSLAGR